MILDLIALVAIAQSPTPIMFRQDPAHTGVSRAPGFAGQAGVRWRVQTGGPVRSSPAVTRTRVFVGSGDGYLYALDRRTGRVVWRYRAGTAVASSPAVAGGLVMAASAGSRVFALDEPSGRVRWSVQTGPLLPHDFDRGAWDYYLSSPVIVDSTVIIGAGDGGVYALDVRSGRRRWLAHTHGRVRSTPAVHDGLVVVGSWDARVYAFDLATGAERWVHHTVGDTLVSARWGFDRRAVQSSAGIGDGGVFIGSRDGGLYGLDEQTGERRWRFSHRGSWVIGSPVVRDGRVYVGSSDGHFVQAVDGASGRELWRYPTADNVLSSPLLLGDMLVVGTFDGALLALDATSGARRWQLPLGAPVLSSPVAADAEIYVGTDDGSVVAIQEVLPRPARLAVFWDSSLARFAYARGGRMARDYLEQRGYAVLDADSLAAFLVARIGDGAPSAVVFALDVLPRSVAGVIADTVLFRRYLESGAKVVWLGPPVGAIGRDSTGAITSYVAERMDTLVGVPAAAINFNQHPDVPTPAGRAWGLGPGGHGEGPIDPTYVSLALTTNEDGKAACWVRAYAKSAPGMGFVQLWGGNGVTAERLPMISAVAEYGLLRPARAP